MSWNVSCSRYRVIKFNNFFGFLNLPRTFFVINDWNLVHTKLFMMSYDWTLATFGTMYRVIFFRVSILFTLPNFFYDDADLSSIKKSAILFHSETLCTLAYFRYLVLFRSYVAKYPLGHKLFECWIDMLNWLFCRITSERREIS